MQSAEQRVLPVAQGLAVDDLAPQRAAQPVQPAVEERDELLLGAHGLERLQIVQRVGQQAHQLLGELRLGAARPLGAGDQKMHGGRRWRARSAMDARASFQDTTSASTSITNGLDRLGDELRRQLVGLLRPADLAAEGVGDPAGRDARADSSSARRASA